jgi:hypothetical protein
VFKTKKKNGDEEGRRELTGFVPRSDDGEKPGRKKDEKTESRLAKTKKSAWSLTKKDGRKG